MSEFKGSGQLPLPVRLDDSATLENFYVADESSNQSLLRSIQKLSTQSLYLWGSEGAGITHILQALCHQTQEQQQSAIYIPLQEFRNESPDQVLAGLEVMDLVCLDDIDAVASDTNWSEQLFHLFNRALSTQCRLVFGANLSPKQMDTPLADLRSRLNSLLVHRVEKLSDEEIVHTLIFRSRGRGMDMPEAVAQYLVTRFSRKLADQFSALDILDRATLAEKRKLTVPFVKSILDDRSNEERP